MWANTPGPELFEKHRRRGSLSPSPPSFPGAGQGAVALCAFWCFCCELLLSLCRTNEQCETLAARVQLYGCVCLLSVRFQLTAAALDRTHVGFVNWEVPADAWPCFHCLLQRGSDSSFSCAELLPSCLLGRLQLHCVPCSSSSGSEVLGADALWQLLLLELLLHRGLSWMLLQTGGSLFLHCALLLVSFEKLSSSHVKWDWKVSQLVSLGTSVSSNELVWCVVSWLLSPYLLHGLPHQSFHSWDTFF